MRILPFILFLLCLGNLQAQTLTNFSLKDIGQSMIMMTDGNGKTVNMGLDMENYGTPFFDSDFFPAPLPPYHCSFFLACTQSHALRLSSVE